MKATSPSRRSPPIRLSRRPWSSRQPTAPASTRRTTRSSSTPGAMTTAACRSGTTEAYLFAAPNGVNVVRPALAAGDALAVRGGPRPAPWGGGDGGSKPSPGRDRRGGRGHGRPAVPADAAQRRPAPARHRATRHSRCCASGGGVPTLCDSRCACRLDVRMPGSSPTCRWREGTWCSPTTGSRRARR